MYSDDGEEGKYYYMLCFESENDNWSEISLKTVCNRDKGVHHVLMPALEAIPPYKFYMNNFSIKIKHSVTEKVNIKISCERGEFLYLRQITSASPDEIIIETNDWCRGSYSLTLTSMTNKKVVTGEFKIR